MIEAIKGVIKSGLVAFATSNILFSVFFSSMLGILWGAINTIQVIMYTVLFSILMPINCYDILIAIMEVTNLDLINSRKYLDMMMTL